MAVFIIPIPTRKCAHQPVQFIWLRDGLCARSSGRRFSVVSKRPIRIVGAGRGQQRDLGRYAAFLAYTAVLNPWFPNTVIPPVSILVTALEILLAIMLLVGFQRARQLRSALG